ncbi:MAG: hypothetical protein MHM6MM_000676 [Cercozoa sp. M6MM]
MRSSRDPCLPLRITRKRAVKESSLASLAPPAKVRVRGATPSLAQSRRTVMPSSLHGLPTPQSKKKRRTRRGGRKKRAASASVSAAAGITRAASVSAVGSFADEEERPPVPTRTVSSHAARRTAQRKQRGQKRIANLSLLRLKTERSRPELRLPQLNRSRMPLTQTMPHNRDVAEIDRTVSDITQTLGVDSLLSASFQEHSQFANRSLMMLRQRRIQLTTLNRSDMKATLSSSDSAKRRELDERMKQLTLSREEASRRKAAQRQRVSPKLQSKIAPLSEADSAAEQRALSSAGPIVTKFNIAILPEHMQRLCPGQWLNDELVNFYMSMINERSNAFKWTSGKTKPEITRKDGIKVFAWSSFFYERLSRNGYTFKNVARWTKKQHVDVFALDLMIVPINRSNVHWTMATVDFRDKTVRYYDSMHNDGADVRENLLSFLQDEFVNTRRPHRCEELGVAEIPFDRSEWTTEAAKCPKQSNGFDCGMFVCKFADFLSDELPVEEVTQERMTYFRKRAYAEIERGCL